MKSKTNLAERCPRLRIRRRETHLIRPAAPRPERRDCQGQLLARLRIMAGPNGMITEATMRPWCSATFVGAQHRLVLTLSGPDAHVTADMLVDTLGEADFALHGHIVADAIVDAIHMAGDEWVALTLAILTIEEW